MDTHQAELSRIVEGFNDNAVDNVVTLLGRDYFDYVPRQGEQTQPEAFTEVLNGIRGGMPDGVLTVGEPEQDGDDLVVEAVLAGHYTGTMWGVPGLGQPFEVRGKLRSRRRPDGLALAAEGIVLPLVLRAAGVIPYISFAHERSDHPALLPEVLWRLLFNDGKLEEKPCSHLDQIAVVDLQGDRCAPCDDEGTEYPRLRQCLTCGHVSCCDTSINKHAMKHSEQTGHPLIRSAIPGEAWIWCYPDKAMLSSWHLRDWLDH